MAKVEQQFHNAQGSLIKPTPFHGVEKIDNLDQQSEKQEKKGSLQKFNYPRKLGISVRIKDISLAVLASLGCGYSAFHCLNDSRLFLHVFPFQMFLISGISVSYLRKMKYTLKTSALAALLTTTITVGVSLYLNSKLDKLSLLFRPIGWIMEHIGIRFLSSRYLGLQMGPVTDTDFASQAQRVQRWVRGAVSLGVTLISGSLVGAGVNIFRFATNKRWL
eukprot:TRINITY_DN1738_c0_g1_i1.p1 TRINITY_DN1738_c0_g1~~TRINITY_DN1738_c0_g1_i1.p1  ORF type:complete len:219 (+),score=29.14 TRINITY_DN1738_c0_g1_i1:247-903(+)